MEPTDFDRLSRTFAEALSRRRLTVLGSLSFTALIPGLTSRVTEARGKHQGKHALHAQKKKKKKKKKPAKPVAPPASPPGSPPGPPPVSPPPPPPAPSCPQAAAPNFCASASACAPACPSGQVFDAATCKCACAEQKTCCYCSCQDGINFSCSPGGVSTLAECKTFCGNFCVEDPNTVTRTFAGGSGSNASCDFANDTCNVTCETDTVCGTANQCQASASCGHGRGSCVQPLGGGPTRCAEGVTNPGCGCTSHQFCVDLNGPGAFCSDATGCSALGCPGGVTTVCVRSL